jgi:hypothetical protein
VSEGLVAYALDFLAWVRRHKNIVVLATAASLIVLPFIFLSEREVFLPHKVVISSTQPTFRKTARDFINTNESVPSGLGLYSYLLISDREPANRNKAAIKTYIGNFGTFPELHTVPRNQINGFFVFTTRDLEWVDQCRRTYSDQNSSKDLPELPQYWSCSPGGKKITLNLDELADRVLPYLDYERASRILNSLRENGAVPDATGLYIVSYLDPLEAHNSIDTGKLLVQDLSRTPPDYVESWVREVARQFAVPEYWNADAFSHTVLWCRTALAVFAPSVTLTEKAIASEIGKRLLGGGASEK